MTVSLHLFDRSADKRSFRPGEVVFAVGDHGEAMYVVLEGEVDVEVNGCQLETAGPGSLVGEMALIDHGPRSATVRARTQAVLAEVGEKQFLFLVHEHPTFALNMMRLIADRLRKMNSASPAAN